MDKKELPEARRHFSELFRRMFELVKSSKIVRMLWQMMLLCVALAVWPFAASAQAGDTVVARELGPGASYRQFVVAAGPFVVSLVRVDLRRSDLELRVLRAHDGLRGREKTSDMVRRAQAAGDIEVVAAVNGDFFNVQTGENENNQVIAGEWWKGLKVTDSPYDTYDNTHVQFALAAARPAARHRPVHRGRDCMVRKHRDTHRQRESESGRPTRRNRAVHSALWRYGSARYSPDQPRRLRW